MTYSSLNNFKVPLTAALQERLMKRGLIKKDGKLMRKSPNSQCILKIMCIFGVFIAGSSRPCCMVIQIVDIATDRAILIMYGMC